MMDFPQFLVSFNLQCSNVCDFSIVDFFRFLISFLLNLNSLVLLIGIILSIFHWKRHPRISLLTIIAFAMFFTASLVDTLYSWAGLMDDIQQRVWGLDPGFVLRVSSFISILLNAGAWILLLVVIFGYKDLIHWRRHFKDLCLAIIALVLPPIIALVFFILVIMKNEPIWDLDRIFVLKILSIISAVSWILLFAVIFGYEEMLDLYSECKKMLKKVLKKGAKELRKFFLFQEE